MTSSALTVTCYACTHTVTAPAGSYQEWEDFLRKRGWEIGEEIVLCPRCVGSS